MKKRYAKKLMSATLASVMVMSMLSGCGSADSKSTEATEQTAEASTDEDIEIWSTNNGYLPVEAGSELYNFYKDIIGVGIVQPYVEWNGGETYLEQLNLRIAAGDMPDMFTPWNGVETELIANGALLDLTDLLPEKAPHLWESIPGDVWDAVKANDPTGQNRIYVIPQVMSYGRNGAMIRKDWLDQVGLEVPTSNEELIAAMKAFKDAGLGVENSPLITKSFTYFYNWIKDGTSEDELAKYLDLNVAPFTWEATKNYLQDANTKYNEGLIDPEFYLTTDDSLAKGKFVSGQCATYSFYMSNGTDVFDSLKANDPNAEVAVLGSTVSNTVADGYTAHYYEYPSYGMIMGINANATDEERAATYMFLDWMSQPENLTYLQHGIEGETYNMVDGKHQCLQHRLHR